jgi:hypothetical protein
MFFFVHFLFEVLCDELLEELNLFRLQQIEMVIQEFKFYRVLNKNLSPDNSEIIFMLLQKLSKILVENSIYSSFISFFI